MRFSICIAIVFVVCMTAGCGKKGGQDQEKPIPRPDLRITSQNNLKNIGTAYLQAAITGPPQNSQDLGLPDNVLKSPKDKEPYEIVWGVDLNRLTDRSSVLLAWEKTPDKEGGRCVLFADGNPGYLSEAQFQQAAKAKGK